MDNESLGSSQGALTKTVAKILAALEELDEESQRRTLLAVATLLGVPLANHAVPFQSGYERNVTSGAQGISFSENRDMSPKEFLRDKSPKTDVERVACLAYYLTHYRDVPHFKTLDISTLNTEAAQPKFSNAAVAVDSATRSGLLVPAVKGTKQISAAGELFVQALPDRDAAKDSIKGLRPKRKTKKNTVKRSEVEQ